jgi:pyruvate/2-oxoglutarate dehydrogenase complex dihydrolipoamide acyltransferase (E2) component
LTSQATAPGVIGWTQQGLRRIRAKVDARIRIGIAKNRKASNRVSIPDVASSYSAFQNGGPGMGVAPLKMPQLGESVTEGTVDKWLKKEGDFIKRDEPIVEVVTDKVNAEIPSPFEGRLVKISVAEGQTVAVGVELAQIETEAAVTPVAAPVQPAAPAQPAPAAAPISATAAVAASAVPATAGDRPRFSPAVRRLAEEHGIDPSTIPGSGENGRVTRDDVLAHVAGQGVAQPAAAVAAAATVPRPRPPPGSRRRTGTGGSARLGPPGGAGQAQRDAALDRRAHGPQPGHITTRLDPPGNRHERAGPLP